MFVRDQMFVCKRVFVCICMIVHMFVCVFVCFCVCLCVFRDSNPRMRPVSVLHIVVSRTPFYREHSDALDPDPPNQKASPAWSGSVKAALKVWRWTSPSSETVKKDTVPAGWST